MKVAKITTTTWLTRKNTFSISTSMCCALVETSRFMSSVHTFLIARDFGLRYYKHKATPKVGLTPIFLVLVTLISVVQWFYWSHRHSQMLREAMGHTQLRRQAKKIADDNELLKGKNKDEIEKILQEIILDNLDVHGRCGKPDIHAVLWVQIIKSP